MSISAVGMVLCVSLVGALNLNLEKPLDDIPLKKLEPLVSGSLPERSAADDPDASAPILHEPVKPDTNPLLAESAADIELVPETVHEKVVEVAVIPSGSAERPKVTVRPNKISEQNRHQTPIPTNSTKMASPVVSGEHGGDADELRSPTDDPNVSGGEVVVVEEPAKWWESPSLTKKKCDEFFTVIVSHCGLVVRAAPAPQQLDHNETECEIIMDQLRAHCMKNPTRVIRSVHLATQQRQNLLSRKTADQRSLEEFESSRKRRIRRDFMADEAILDPDLRVIFAKACCCHEQIERKKFRKQ